MPTKINACKGSLAIGAEGGDCFFVALVRLEDGV
jgi:hypothetical protein